MTVREAWKVVETELAAFTALPVFADDNSDAVPIPDDGGARLKLSTGAQVPYASPGVFREPLAFVLELNVPKGSGNGLVQDYAEQVRAIFRNQTLLAPSGGSGVLVCLRTQSDFLGAVRDGRDFYRALATLVFDNFTYT